MNGCNLRGVAQFSCLSMHDSKETLFLCSAAAEVPIIPDDVAMVAWSSGWWWPNDSGPWSCILGLVSTSPDADQYVPCTPASATGPT